MSVAAGAPIHPGYALQGETLDALLDPGRDERGRARLSCVCCIFAQPRHITAALQRAPALVEPFVRRVHAYEQAAGYTWQQRGALNLAPPGVDLEHEPHALP